jgi:hypothetical protein
MKAHMLELAISAVPYDALLVAELTDHLAVRLQTVPFWAGNGRADSMGHDGAEHMVDVPSRLALVLHQRLWGHDSLTRSDDEALRERVRQHPGSVRVVTLDDEPLPAWLTNVAQCDLVTLGLDGVVEFVVDGVAAAGGVTAQLRPAEPIREPQRRWPDGPAPFLSQPRAFSALRRELDLLAAELKPQMRIEETRAADRTAELQLLPNRVVVRLDDVGISFSWVAGRLGTVADGRLLVIQWNGAVPRSRGVAAMTSATPVRERVYRAEGSDPESWCWRADAPNGRALSTAHLAAEWLAGATL